MELTFFGTSSGVPTRDRNVSAIALAESMGSSWYLIDCGEGTQHQILKSPYSLMTIEAIFITHTHGDHCFGLPGLLASAGMSGRKNALKIVAPSGIKEWLNTTQEVSETYIPFEIEYYSPTNLADFQMGEFTVSTIKLSHRVDSYAYVFTEASTDPILDTDKLKAKNIPRGPLWGEIQSGKEIVHQEFSAVMFGFMSPLIPKILLSERAK